MHGQPSTGQPPGVPRDKTELLGRIRRSRAALEETLSSLSEEQLTRSGPSGWSIKDHLAHLATWELGIVELLHRRPRFAAMLVGEAVYQDKSEDEINELIYRRHAGLPPAEVMEKFQSVHRQMMATLEAMSEEDLFKPYASYVPEGKEDRRDPVIHWIMGNTYEHFDEHNGYIRALLSEWRNG